MMNFYIVMQGRTYEEEKKHGVICSQIIDKKGETPHFWGRMKEVLTGDLIFHYVKGEIVAISTATSNCYEGIIPYRSSDKGFIVETNYLQLMHPIHIKGSFQHIKPLLPIKYAPFQENGDGNQGYIFSCNEMLAIKFLEMISDSNIYLEDVEQLELAIGAVILKDRNELGVTLSSTIAKTHAKFRKYEKIYNATLAEKWDNQCAICQLDIPELLKATYSKPWKDCTDEEKVDKMNGLLLCSNHAALYSEGLIAFDGTGKIHISNQLSEAQYEKLHLTPKLKVHREEANKPYYKWHKKYVFKK